MVSEKEVILSGSFQPENYFNYEIKVNFLNSVWRLKILLEGDKCYKNYEFTEKKIINRQRKSTTLFNAISSSKEQAKLVKRRSRLFLQRR